MKSLFMTASSIRATVIWSCLDSSHNRAVQRNKARIGRIDSFNKDITRMHIRMEEVVAEHLSKENRQTLRARSARSIPSSSKVAISEIGTPVIRSATSTSLLSI